MTRPDKPYDNGVQGYFSSFKVGGVRVRVRERGMRRQMGRSGFAMQGNVGTRAG